MTEDGSGRVPVSRGDLDRVIRRAAELQLQEGGDDGGELSEAEVLRIGREVGLEAGHLRRALGELRAEALVPTLPPDAGALRSLVGEGRIRADRVVPGEAADIEDRLVRWFSKAESLHAVRRRAGSSLWEPAEGFLAQIQRGLKWQGHRYELAEARQVELSVQELEEGFALVTITLDARNLRLEVGAGYSTAAAVFGGAVGLAATVTLLPPLAVAGGVVAGAVAGGLGGLAAGRASFRTKGERLRLAAEGLLDRLERGELVPPSERRL